MSKMDKEYLSFSSHSNQSGPKIPSRLMSEVSQDLNPSPFAVFSKLLGIHFISALVTLSICPQFGFRTYGEGMGLMHYFMNLGEYGCLIACGAFFTGTSLAIAGFTLRGEEMRAIRKNRILSSAALALLSIGFFFMLDAEFIFGLSAAWLLGAILGSVLAMEAAWTYRFRLSSSRS